jgi:hypothetical protein
MNEKNKINLVFSFRVSWEDGLRGSFFVNGSSKQDVTPGHKESEILLEFGVVNRVESGRIEHPSKRGFMEPFRKNFEVDVSSFVHNIEPNDVGKEGS